MANENAIKNPGVRPSKHGGVVIQQKKRSEQLEGIADTISKTINDADQYQGNAQTIIHLTLAQVRQINGYMEQCRIIADELKNAGK